jgi:hypothetical protein
MPQLKMEAALNLLWLTLTVCALFAWKLRWSRQPLPKSRFLSPNIRFIALCCALVLLFFVISVSDDLQQATGLIEDSASRSSSPFKSKFSTANGHDTTPAATDASLVGGLLQCPRICFRRVNPSDIFDLSTVALLPLQGRSPPLSARS